MVNSTLNVFVIIQSHLTAATQIQLNKVKAVKRLYVKYKSNC